MASSRPYATVHFEGNFSFRPREINAPAASTEHEFPARNRQSVSSPHGVSDDGGFPGAALAVRLGQRQPELGGGGFGEAKHSEPRGYGQYLLMVSRAEATDGPSALRSIKLMIAAHKSTTARS